MGSPLPTIAPNPASDKSGVSPPDQAFLERDIAISDIVAFFRNGWKALGLSCAMGLILGLAYLAIAKPVYVANTSFSILRVEKLPTDSAGELAERLRQPLVYNEQVLQSCGYSEANNESYQDLVDNRVRFGNPRGTSIVTVAARANSPAAAERCARSVAATAIAFHNRALEPRKGQLQSELAGLETRLSVSRELRNRHLQAMQRSIEFDKKLLAVHMSSRAKYFESLRRELQNSEKALNDIDGLVGATVNGQQAKGTNDELRAAALLLLHERMTKLQARVDEIKLALDSNLAPNELDIQNISVRIADAEAKVSAGDTPFELDMQRQQSEVDKARREIDAMSPASAAPVFASPRPVEPRRSLVLALSFFFGGAAGVVYLLWARWQRSQDPA